MRFAVTAAVLLLSVSAVRAQYAIRPESNLAPLRMSPVAAKERPLYVDNSKSPYFPPIITQSGNSCAQASGIHYLFTYEMNRTLERSVQDKPENTFSYKWTWNFLNEGENSGSISSDGLEMTKIAGCMTVRDFGDENDYVYRWPTGYSKYYNAMHYRTKSMSYVDLSTMQDIETLMDYMADKGDGHPGGGMAVFSLSGDWGVADYNGPSETGIRDMIVLQGSGGAHAMTFVGYDRTVEYDCNRDDTIQENEKGAFILVNSWGTWWGTSGFAYLPFSYYLNSVPEGGLPPSEHKALCIETEYHEPTVTMGVRLKYSSRNDLILRFGVADGAQSEEPESDNIMNYPIVRAQGGDLYMQGTKDESGKEIEMGFDLSSLKHAADTMKAPCWFLVVIKVISGKSGEGYVSQVTLHDYSSGTDKTTTEKFNTDKGKISMTKVFKVPTKPWFKNTLGEWCDTVSTSSNPLAENREYLKPYKWKNIYGIRKSDGGYAMMKVTDCDPGNRTLTIDIANYE